MKMVNIIYECEVCGKDDFKSLEDAKAHEKILIKKTNYSGLILKDVGKDKKYSVWIKLNVVSTKHEEVYSYIFGEIKENEFYFHKGLLPHSASTIERLVKEKKYKGVNKEEFSKLVQMLKNQELEIKKEVEEFGKIKKFSSK